MKHLIIIFGSGAVAAGIVGYAEHIERRDRLATAASIDRTIQEAEAFAEAHGWVSEGFLQALEKARFASIVLHEDLL